MQYNKINSKVTKFKRIKRVLYIIFFIILGPGFYNIQNNTFIDNFSNTYWKKPKKSAFGSSVPRTLFLVQKEDYTTPGPADYKVICEYQNYIICISYEEFGIYKITYGICTSLL